MDIVTLVVLVALLEYVVFILVVGGTRGRYGVLAPATTGHDKWERLYRVQVNTAEQLVLFIPAIYAFAYYVSTSWATGIGCVFLVGRVLYFLGYSKAGKKRMPGAVMSSFPSYILVIGALIGLVRQVG